MAGWMNQHQHHIINYLIEENRVLREWIGNWRLRFSNDQLCRLAVKAKKLGRKILAQVGTVPEWRKKIGIGVIAGFNEHWPISDICSHTIRSPIF